MRATGGMVWRYSGGCRDEAYNESIIRDDNDDEFQGWPEPVGREHKNKFNQVQPGSNSRNQAPFGIAFPTSHHHNLCHERYQVFPDCS